MQYLFWLTFPSVTWTYIWLVVCCSCLASVYLMHEPLRGRSWKKLPCVYPLDSHKTVSDIMEILETMKVIGIYPRPSCPGPFTSSSLPVNSIILIGRTAREVRRWLSLSPYAPPPPPPPVAQMIGGYIKDAEPRRRNFSRHVRTTRRRPVIFYSLNGV